MGSRSMPPAGGALCSLRSRSWLYAPFGRARGRNAWNQEREHSENDHASRGAPKSGSAASIEPRARAPASIERERQRARAFFITLEGAEGGGKSTQARLLAEALRQRGWETLQCAEPGGGKIPRAIRALLLDPDSAGMVTRAELLLFLAARAQHVEETIRPALAAGQVVICDRFADSTMAYQGHAAGLDLATVSGLNDFATGGLAPDLTLLLDIEPEIGLARQQEWNRMEAKGLEFHRRVREGFLAEARRCPERIHVLDASRPVDAVHADILGLVMDLLQTT